MPKLTFLLKYNEYLKDINKLSIDDDLTIYKEHKEEKIVEGLIKTQPVEKSINILSRRFPELKVQNGRDYGEIYLEGDFDNIDKYIPLINNLGYFISLLTINGEDWIKEYESITKPLAIYIEPKYDLIIENIPKVLFHTSPIKYTKNILKVGLIPRSKNKLSNHPERIYLTDKIDICKNFGDYIIDNGIDKDYSVFVIDTNNLNLTLYRDINMKAHGYYTLQNISPKNIKQIK